MSAIALDWFGVRNGVVSVNGGLACLLRRVG